MKIPENANPYRAIVNGVEHAYEAGAETEVAEGVEELINAAGNFPADPAPVIPPFGTGGGGGGGGVLVVNAVTDSEANTFTLNKTWQEIHDAFLSSGAVISDIEGSLVTAITGVGSIAPNRYVVESGGEAYVTSTSDGYPAASSQ